MKKKRIIKEIVTCSLIVAIPFLLFTFVVKLAFVSGNSMNDTYQNGDMLLCLRHSTPKNGDVIVTDSDADVVLIKRVIASGGDTIDIDFETGTVTVNGEVLKEDYIKESTTLNEGGFEYPLTVPDDCYFVMGDNRNNSRDSRSGDVNFIRKEQIQGKVFLELYSFSSTFKIIKQNYF